MLKPHYQIIRVADNNNLPARHFLAPCFHPKVEDVMQVQIRKQRRDHRPLRRTHFRLLPFAFFHHSRLQPFLNDAQNAVVGHTMLNELHRPFVAHSVEKASNVGVQHPVHLAAHQPHIQRIQRLMRTLSRTKTVREALEVHLINLIEDGHHSLLNNFVLQRRDSQRTLPSVGLQNIDSPRGLCPVCATVDATVEIGEPPLQSRSVPPPRPSVNARCCFSLQSEIALPEQIDGQMVQQCRELLLLPFPCSLTHTAQPMGHTSPALRRSRVRLRDVLLDPRSSLPNLRQRLPALVRLAHRYYTEVRLLRRVHVRRLATGLSGPASYCIWRNGGLPVLVHEVSQRARGLRLRGTRRRLAISPPPVLPSSFVTESACPIEIFEAQYPAQRCHCLRFTYRLATARAKLAVRMDSLSPFLQGSFIPCFMPVYPGAPQHSPGPRTPAGRLRSSLNALTHGLTGRTVLLPSEDPAAHQLHTQE